MARGENINPTSTIRLTTSEGNLTLFKLVAAARGLSTAQFMLNCALERLGELSFDIEEGQPAKKFADMSPREVVDAISFAEKLLAGMRENGKGGPSQ